MKLHDQRTDKSRACLVKIANRLSDASVSEAVLKLAMSNIPAPEKDIFAWEGNSMFPVGSAEDTVLSRAYFNGQRAKLASDIADALDERIGLYEALYGLDLDMGMREFEKVAQRSAELLPGYIVTEVEGLVKAAEEFEAKFTQLDTKDRCAFADSFVKIAAEWECEATNDAIMTYSGSKGCNEGLLREYLGIRKTACRRTGQETTYYDDMLAALDSGDLTVNDREGMVVVAQCLQVGDEQHGFTSAKYDNKMPDAWHAVFNEKVAEEADGTDISDNEQRKDYRTMTKGDIIARFGEDALDVVEDEQGEIDYGRLKEVVRLFGGENIQDDNNEI